MNQIKDRIRQDPRFAQQSTTTAMGALAAGTGSQTAPSDTAIKHTSSSPASATLIKFATMLAGVIVLSVSIYEMAAHKGYQSRGSGSLKTVATQNTLASTVSGERGTERVAQAGEKDSAGQSINSAKAGQSAITKQVVQSGDEYVLDQYPAPIKISLVETARGSSGYQPARESAPVPALGKKSADSGSLFSLLESAGDKDRAQPGPSSLQNDETNSQDPYVYEQESDEEWDEDSDQEEERRAQIRERFLEAIRAASERRQAGDEAFDN